MSTALDDPCTASDSGYLCPEGRPIDNVARAGYFRQRELFIARTDSGEVVTIYQGFSSAGPESRAYRADAAWVTVLVRPSLGVVITYSRCRAEAMARHEQHLRHLIDTYGDTGLTREYL